MTDTTQDTPSLAITLEPGKPVVLPLKAERIQRLVLTLDLGKPTDTLDLPNEDDRGAADGIGVADGDSRPRGERDAA